MKIAFFSTNQNFCGSILEELSSHHTLKNCRFTGNKNVDNTNMMGLINWCDLIYVDFIQYPLPWITRQQWVDKPIVARMDGIDILNHTQVDWRKVNALVLMPVQQKRLTKLRKQITDAGGKVQKLPRLLIKNVGIDLQRFQPDYNREPGYTIGFHAFVARPTKRVYTMFQTFLELLRKDPDKPWRLHYMGAGWDPGSYNWGEREEYIMSVLELLEDIDPEIKGRLKLDPFNSPAEQWAPVARNLDIMWSTSYREGFPNSIGEAAASGAWPLMNKFYGSETIYKEENICWTPTEMVEKTIKWGNLSREAKIAAKHHIRKHMEQYDRHQTARDIRQLCEEVYAECG